LLFETINETILMKNKSVLLIPHYNNLIGLKKSINSIGANEKIDVLIIDDGSVAEQIPNKESFEYTSGELIVLKSNTNKGIENALNIGIEYIMHKNHYKYIARLDAGDICKDDRFYKQETFLENNKDIYLIGSHVDFIDNTGKYKYTYKVPLHHKKIKRNMFLKNSFIHSSVMYKTDVFNLEYYPVKYKYTEDYALFYRIINNHTTANFDEVLTSTELSKTSISYKKRRIQLINRLRLSLKNISFNPYFFYGTIRILILLIVPNSVNQFFKLKYYNISQ